MKSFNLPNMNLSQNMISIIILLIVVIVSLFIGSGTTEGMANSNIYNSIYGGMAQLIGGFCGFINNDLAKHPEEAKQFNVMLSKQLPAYQQSMLYTNLSIKNPDFSCLGSLSTVLNSENKVRLSKILERIITFLTDIKTNLSMPDPNSHTL